jgi:hypothetical protein
MSGGDGGLQGPPPCIFITGNAVPSTCEEKLTLDDAGVSAYQYVIVGAADAQRCQRWPSGHVSAGS